MQPPRSWRFGPFEADLPDRQLRREGRAIPVTPKAFTLLEALIARRGKLVSKNELFDGVWGGRAVTDGALSRAIRELRLALEDDADSPRYIATVHGLGFRFVAEVHAVAGAGEPMAVGDVAAGATGAGAVVGRGAELAALERALALADGGRRQVAFVTGEAGIGKTALIDAFAQAASARGDLVVVQGRCIEQYGTGEAYLPVLEALESLARRLDADVLRSVLLRYAPAWLVQLPWLAHDVDPAALQRALAGATAQRMLREIAQALEILSAERTLVLWLEDLHWSDYSTLDVISVLAGRRERARLMLVCSFRPEDAQDREAPLGDLVRGLRQKGQASEIALGVLDAPAIDAYLRVRLGPEAAASLPIPEMAGVIHARTGGNCLFAVTVVDSWLQDGRLARRDDGWILDAEPASLSRELPDSLRQLVQAQIDRLSDEQRRVVEAAAVAGVDFCAASLAAALQCEITEAEEQCLALARAGRFLRRRAAVVWPDGTESAGFGFAHALYWQGAYEHAAAARRAEWQRRIALREEQAYGTQSALIATVLAVRFETARDFTRALHYLQIAGAAALSRCAYKESAGLLRRGLVLVDKLPEDVRQRRRLETMLPLGAALMALEGYASDEVETIYRQALALCREVGRPGEVDRVLRGLWNVALVRPDLDQARVLADEMTVRAAAARPAARFDALAKSGQTSMHRGALATSRRELEQALAVPADDDGAARQREVPRVLAYLSWVLWYTGHPVQARQRAEEALRLARDSGSMHTTAFVLGFAGWLHVFLGRTADVEAVAREQMHLASEHDLVYWRTWSDALLGLAAARGGDARNGLARMRQAIDSFEAMGARVGVSHFLCQLGEAELIAGVPAAADTIARSARLLEMHANAYHAADVDRVRGLIAAARGDHAQAEADLHAAIACARGQDARALELRALTDLARLQSVRGNVRATREELARVLATFAEDDESVDLQAARRLLASG